MRKVHYSHDLEYVRTQIIPALADFSGETKGQLAAFEDSPLMCTDHYKRNKTYIQVGSNWVTQEADPVFCPETRMRKGLKPPINPVTYNLSSWRRAILAIDTPHRAWVLYCYAHDLNYSYQIEICQYLWNCFRERQKDQKLIAKVKARLSSLVWLAAQQYAGECRGDGSPYYTHAELANLAGVSVYNWKKRYVGYWQCLMCLCKELDAESLQDVTRLRISQKRHVGLQKSPN
ncbi:bacteriophage antitermination protein Q [Xenorhabdus khoisanae]|uniref:bacteriophage antitermination protein Q n=1 Tax=Xenorhabdus khoisanae TaxID=880157 RepID=UPI0023594102|nr:bacteriophage antitermination protein Q [Xenorhabdus khoisanae]MDC9614205.1 bacteriophage antitermination protein Q [Xenorhabdus khoisanae]